MLEKAVRWVIIMLVAVFDPLAIMMLLAATESLKWEREKRARKYDPDDGPLTDEQIAQLRESANAFNLPTGEIISKLAFAPNGRDLFVMTTNSKLKILRLPDEGVQST